MDRHHVRLPTPPLASSDSSGAIEALRKTFRESLEEKDQQLARFQQQVEDLQQQRLAGLNTGDATEQLSSEIQDLEHENEYLRQEFEKLRSRYEALVKSSKRTKAS